MLSLLSFCLAYAAFWVSESSKRASRKKKDFVEYFSLSVFTYDFIHRFPTRKRDFQSGPRFLSHLHQNRTCWQQASSYLDGGD